MNIGKAKITEGDYQKLLKLLITQIQSPPYTAISIHNTIYEILYSSEHYEDRLYRDMCDHYNKKAKIVQKTYLEDFYSLKENVTAISDLCLLLYDAMHTNKRKISDIAFIMWEKEKLSNGILKGKMLGLVGELAEENFLAEFKDEFSGNFKEFLDLAGLGENVKQSENLPDEIKKTRDFYYEKSGFRLKNFDGNIEEGDLNKNIVNKKILLDGLNKSSSNKYGLKQNKSVVDDRYYNVTLDNLKEHLVSLTYIVPDKERPNLYYECIYESNALNSIAISCIVEYGFLEYVDFSAYKLKYELDRMDKLFIESSKLKLYRVLDFMLVIGREDFILQNLRKLITEILRLKEVDEHIPNKKLLQFRTIVESMKYFYSFNDILKKAINFYVVDFYKQESPKDINDIFNNLRLLQSFIAENISKKWGTVAKALIKPHLNAIKNVGVLLVDMAKKVIEDGILEKEFKSIFPFLDSKYKFESYFLVYFEKRLLEVMNKTFCGDNVSKKLERESDVILFLEKNKCTQDFTRKLKLMVADVKGSFSVGIEENRFIFPYILTSSVWTSEEMLKINIAKIDFSVIIAHLEEVCLPLVKRKFLNWQYRRSRVLVEINNYNEVNMNLLQYLIFHISHANTVKQIAVTLEMEELVVLNTVDVFKRYKILVESDGVIYVNDKIKKKNIFIENKEPENVIPLIETDLILKCQSNICAFLKKNKTVCKKELTGILNIEAALIDMAVSKCISQGFIKEDVDLLHYVP